MKTLDFKQGSSGWKAARANYHCASDAAAAMGLSPYKSRTDLLREKATGDTPEVDAATQARFDQGHATEASARTILEADIGDDLYPITATDDAGYLLASSDGVTMTGDVGFEHKLWSEERAAAVRAGDLLPQDWPQAEQNIRVFGLKSLYFVVSDGTADKREILEYRAVPGRMERVMAAWKQFDEDVKNYQHVEVLPAAVATPVMALPALSINVQGSLTLTDNLSLFGEKLTAFIGNINKEPKNDQDFADLEAAVKTLQAAQDALESAENLAMSQTASINEMRRTVEMYRDLARSNRLMFDKLVKAKKESIRAEIISEGQAALRAHIAGLNKRLGKPYMPDVPADFAGAMKGKKTIASLRDVVATTLANAKITANEIADKIDANLRLLREEAVAHDFLFADTAQIVLKAPDDFAILVKSRIDAHKEAEEKKAADLREKIRTEEVAKIEAQQRAEAQQKAAAAQVMPHVGPTTRPEVDVVDQHAVVVPAFAAAPIKAPSAWGVPKKVQRPTDAAIIRAVAQAFGVDDNTATDWIAMMDFSDQAA